MDVHSTRTKLWFCQASMMTIAASTSITPVYMTTFSANFGGSSGLSEEQLGRITGVMIASESLRWDVSWRWVCGALILLPVSVFLGFQPVHVPPMVHEDHDRGAVGSLLRRKQLWARLLLIFPAGRTEMSVAQSLPARSGCWDSPSP